MEAIPSPRGRSWNWQAPIDASAAALELAASEQPELLEFLAHVLRNSTMSFAAEELAAVFGVAPEKLGPAVVRACLDLDRLEKHRGPWRDPAAVLRKGAGGTPVAAPNLAALHCVCRARLQRVTQLARRRRLERILRRVDAACQLARTRAWLEDFIGPPAEKPREVRDDDR